MRVALVCPTIGQTRRGYERYFSDLFRFLRDRIDIVLFKGAGAIGPQERVIAHLSRTGLLRRLCRDRLRYTRYRLEFASFAAGLSPYLIGGQFDLVHFIDPPLGPHLARLKRFARLEAALIFSNAGPLSCDASLWADHIHCLSPLALDEAEQMHLHQDRLSLVPMGVDPTALRAPAPRAEIRSRLGLRPDQFVVLSVASVNRHHKRVDYLIQEVAGMRGDAVLWLDGSLHPDGDPSLIALGKQLLGERFRYTHLPSESVPELLAIADVFVSAATYESFGMAISEAMTAGVPVPVHDSEHFRWLVQDQGHCIDMSISGNLAARLERFMECRHELQSKVDVQAVVQRFGWPRVAQEHLEMYDKALRRSGHSQGKRTAA